MRMKNLIFSSLLSLLLYLLLSLLSISLNSYAFLGWGGGYGEKVIVVDPSQHVFRAYDAAGNLVRSGQASSGADFCKDLGQPCHTQAGEFRIRSLGGSGCKSPSFPLGRGGSPMPYCMYFNSTQALHGSYEMGGNISHGCVRLHVADAKWLRYNFATIGTLVIIHSY